MLAELCRARPTYLLLPVECRLYARTGTSLTCGPGCCEPFVTSERESVSGDEGARSQCLRVLGGRLLHANEWTLSGRPARRLIEALLVEAGRERRVACPGVGCSGLDDAPPSAIGGDSIISPSDSLSVHIAPH